MSRRALFVLSPGLVLAVLLAAIAQDKADPVKKDAAALDEVWNFVQVEAAGVKSPRQPRGEPYRTITFKGDKFEVKQGETAILSGSWKIDPAKNPKTIDLAVTEGAGRGTVQLGIYELGADTLKLCLDPKGKERPREFVGNEGSGQHLIVLQRERAEGLDPRDASILYERIHRMNSGFKAYNGKAYDVAALAVAPKTKLVLPEKSAIVEKHDLDDVVLIYTMKRAFIGAHFVRSVSIGEYRKNLGVAAKLDKGELLIGTYGEYGFLEGSVSMQLLVLVPPKLEVARRAGLSGGYGGRAGSERPEGALNPARDEAKPALTESKEGTPPRWLPPAKEDGWHEIPATPDATRRFSKHEPKVEEKKKKK